MHEQHTKLVLESDAGETGGELEHIVILRVHEQREFSKVLLKFQVQVNRIDTRKIHGSRWLNCGLRGIESERKHVDETSRNVGAMLIRLHKTEILSA